jgi:hypothetical protein
MPKRLRLIVYKEDPVNYRYIVHGANPSLRGRFRTRMPFNGEAEWLPSKMLCGPPRAAWSRLLPISKWIDDGRLRAKAMSARPGPNKKPRRSEA